jgi:hypothetical protein
VQPADRPRSLELSAQNEFLPELSEQVSRFSYQASHLGAARKGLSRVCPMLKRIGVAPRRARPLCPAMHTAPSLAGNGGRVAGRPRASPCPTARAAEHGRAASIVSWRSRLFAWRGLTPCPQPTPRSPHLDDLRFSRHGRPLMAKADASPPRPLSTATVKRPRKL